MPRFASSHLEHQRYEDALSLHVTAAETATGTGTIEADMPETASLMCMLDVTAAATDVDDTLDVFIQTRVSGGLATLGNGGAKRYYAALGNLLGQAMFENGTALGAGALRNIVGDLWRCRWAIVDPGAGAASFTFSVGITPMG
jgi:hypothetical protein